MGAQTYNQITKARARERPRELAVMKSDDERRLVFGWANVSVRVDGEQIVDWQQDAIDTADLENAAYEYVANFGAAGEMHKRGGVGRVIESIVFTKEKADALGIPPDAHIRLFKRREDVPETDPDIGLFRKFAHWFSKGFSLRSGDQGGDGGQCTD